MKILITVAQALLYTVAFCVSAALTVFSVYMMWNSGMSPSFFGTLALAFLGFCLFCVGAAATGIITVMMFFSLEEAKEKVNKMKSRNTKS